MTAKSAHSWQCAALAVAGLAATTLWNHAAWALTDQASRPYPFTIDERQLQGPPDRSALNHPLGLADRVFVHNEHFYRVGPDGRRGTGDDTRVRLFGINLSFGTNFPAPEEASRLARQIRKAGFNAVRLHHMDFHLTDDSRQPSGVLSTGPYPSFNPTAVARLRRFIGALSQEGIYVNLNIFVSYQFRPEVDGVPDFGNLSNRLPIGSSVHVYHPRMVERQEAYARGLIDALALKGNPALAMVEISNEASLLAAWTRKEWATHAVPPRYEPVLRSQWNEWLVKRYGSTGAACKAWTTCSPGRTEALDLPSRTAAAPKASTNFDELLRRVRAKWQTLLPIRTDEPQGEALRLRDFLTFLADTDRTYLNRMRTVVHEATDDMVPVTGTQMNYGGVMNFDSHAAMDYIDNHGYIDHPNSPEGAGEQSNWSIRNAALTGEALNVMLAQGFRRDRRKPFVLSEFNMPFPNQQAAGILPAVAAIAALQDWDGVFFFDYLDIDTPSTAPSAFRLSGDWGKYALVGQSAQLFRRSWVEPLPARLDVALPLSARQAITASDQYEGLESLFSQMGVKPTDAWHYRIAADLQADSLREPARPASTALADQARHDPAAHILELDAPKVRGVFADLDERWRGPPGLQARMLARSDTTVQIMLTPLDDAPLASSRHMLLTLGSPTVGTQPGSHPPRPKVLQPYKGQAGRWTLEPDPDRRDMPSGPRQGTAPAWLFHPAVCVRWSGIAPPEAIYPLDGQGKRLPALAAAHVRRGAQATAVDLANLPDTALSPWYEIVLDPSDKAANNAAPPDCTASSE